MSTYYIIRFPDTNETLGRWDISSPYGRVPASFAACFDSREKADTLCARFPGSIVVVQGSPSSAD